MRNASFLRYPFRSKNTLLLLSAARNIDSLFDLGACPANLIWPSFGNTKELIGQDRTMKGTRLHFISPSRYSTSRPLKDFVVNALAYSDNPEKGSEGGVGCLARSKGVAVWGW
jgi:hypothetical protein